MSNETLPQKLRGLRACKVCSLIKEFERFVLDGCDNCEHFLKLKDNRDRVQDCTSQNFDGMIGSLDPEGSWVCKWQHISPLVRGIYAISVSGKLPDIILEELKSKGVSYKSRDKTSKW